MSSSNSHLLFGQVMFHAQSSLLDLPHLALLTHSLDAVPFTRRCTLRSAPWGTVLPSCRTKPLYRIVGSNAQDEVGNKLEEVNGVHQGK